MSLEEDDFQEAKQLMYQSDDQNPDWRSISRSETNHQSNQNKVKKSSLSQLKVKLKFKSKRD